MMRYPSTGRRLAAFVGVALVLAACGDNEADPVTEASADFCGEAEQYISAVDQYGKVFSTADTTVGDLKTAGDDLSAPRRSVESSAQEATDAHSALAEANQELADANAALASAQS